MYLLWAMDAAVTGSDHFTFLPCPFKARVGTAFLSGMGNCFLLPISEKNSLCHDCTSRTRASRRILGDLMRGTVNLPSCRSIVYYQLVWSLLLPTSLLKWNPAGKLCTAVNIRNMLCKGQLLNLAEGTRFPVTGKLW